MPPDHRRYRQNPPQVGLIVNLRRRFSTVTVRGAVPLAATMSLKGLVTKMHKKPSQTNPDDRLAA